MLYLFYKSNDYNSNVYKGTYKRNDLGDLDKCPNKKHYLKYAGQMQRHSIYFISSKMLYIQGCTRIYVNKMNKILFCGGVVIRQTYQIFQSYKCRIIKLEQ